MLGCGSDISVLKVYQTQITDCFLLQTDPCPRNNHWVADVTCSFNATRLDKQEGHKLRTGVLVSRPDKFGNEQVCILHCPLGICTCKRDGVAKYIVDIGTTHEALHLG